MTIYHIYPPHNFVYHYKVTPQPPLPVKKTVSAYPITPFSPGNQ